MRVFDVDSLGFEDDNILLVGESAQVEMPDGGMYSVKVELTPLPDLGLVYRVFLGVRVGQDIFYRVASFPDHEDDVIENTYFVDEDSAKSVCAEVWNYIYHLTYNCLPVPDERNVFVVPMGYDIDSVYDRMNSSV